MRTDRPVATLLPVIVCLAALTACDRTNPAQMTFFVTSVGTGRGGDLGGLDGADAHCQQLAEAAGATGRRWRAYLSAAGEEGAATVHARDRVGRGPWVNVAGVAIAKDVDDLHANNALSRRTALTERGQPIPHDIFTGSNPDGTVAGGDVTCRNWSSGSSGQALVGHSDKQGEGDRPQSWNSAHLSIACDVPSLKQTGGAGLFYCFAID